MKSRIILILFFLLLSLLLISFLLLNKESGYIVQTCENILNNISYNLPTGWTKNKANDSIYLTAPGNDLANDQAILSSIFIKCFDNTTQSQYVAENSLTEQDVPQNDLGILYSRRDDFSGENIKTHILKIDNSLLVVRYFEQLEAEEDFADILNSIEVI